MDLDALRAARRGEWDRLDELTRSRSLSGPEVDELVVRYRSASADLADVKTSAGRTPLGDALSSSLSRARGKLTGAGENVLRQLPRFFVWQLPAALYRLRWTTLAIAVAFLLIGTLEALWISGDPARVAVLGDDAALRAYVEHDFTDYYNPAASFAGTVWTNNAYIAAMNVAFGITGIFPIYSMMMNAISVGQAAGVLIAYDSPQALVYLIPHGLLELTSLFVAAAAGLHVFWSWAAPGRRSRGESLAAAGRSLATVVVGLIIALGLSGLVEGFVTGQETWPWAVRIGIGVVALGVFLTYMLWQGRRATQRGETGDLTEYEAGTQTLFAG
ncbi:stage II sporulation protein M [Microbacterium gorillae]|uniref:stage II sporulation protein M n=1 Tax=Microbacterium gorillae TaxID=1231063 RepID=UPI00058B7234|nr:stage II sporulation protein M [Microbacterium gorillae]